MNSAREDFMRNRKPPRPRSLVPWTIAMLVLMALFMARPAGSQLQQSGGVSLTGALPAGTNTIGKVDVLGNAGATLDSAAGSANSQALTIQGNSGGIAVPVSGTLSVNALPAGANLIGYTRAQNGCGTTNYESVMTNPPTSATSLTATTTCVTVIYVSNTTASAASITIQDQGTGCNSAACVWVDAFSVPANSNMAIPLYGAKFSGGIKWSQGTANALSADVIGNQ